MPPPSAMPGFVWRLKDESGNATSISAYEDPTIILNMSVWESAETFEKFVWQTVHASFYRRRTGWFEPLAQPHFAMWWIEPGHVPTPAEGRARLEHLTEHGPSDHAFGWEELGQRQIVAGSSLWLTSAQVYDRDAELRGHRGRRNECGALCWASTRRQARA